MLVLVLGEGVNHEENTMHIRRVHLQWGLPPYAAPH
jgi:hypothetical protein